VIRWDFSNLWGKIVLARNSQNKTNEADRFESVRHTRYGIVVFDIRTTGPQRSTNGTNEKGQESILAFELRQIEAG
jgi:hypothetical protein